MNELMTHIAGDYLHTKTGSFPLSNIISFEANDQQTIISFVGDKQRVCDEIFPQSVIQNLRNYLSCRSSSNHVIESKNINKRNAFEIFGTKENLEKFASELQKIDIKQPMFLQYFENNSHLFLLIDQTKEQLEKLSSDVEINTAKRSTIYQTEISEFASFKYNTLENKKSVLCPLNLDFMNDDQLNEFTEELFSRFGPKNLFVQMLAGDWGEAYMYLVFVNNEEISLDIRKQLSNMCTSRRATFYPLLTLSHLDYTDDRTAVDVRPFVYNTMPFLKKSEIPRLPDFGQEYITITISDQFTQMSVWEAIAKEIKTRFPDVVMFLMSGRNQMLNLYITLKQQPGLDLFMIEKILTDLNFNLKQFHIAVDPNPPRNPKELVKFPYNTI